MSLSGIITVAILTVAAIGIIWCIAKMFQLNAFSKYMSAEINRRGDLDEERITQFYDNLRNNPSDPNREFRIDDTSLGRMSIDLSYKAWNRSVPWDYNFAEMVRENPK